MGCFANNMIFFISPINSQFYSSFQESGIVLCLIYETNALPTALKGHLCTVVNLKTGGMCTLRGSTLNISLTPCQARILMNELIELL